MEIIPTKFEGAFLIKPDVFGDNRGFFLETYSQRSFDSHGLKANFVQDNHSKSEHAGVLRGLHFQLPPHAQTKLVRATKGKAFDVIVDIRKESPTFGQWEGFELSADNFFMLYIPQGFAHGFQTLENDTEFQYKCDNFYEPSFESGIIWNDPTLNVDWPIKEPILSGRDEKWGQLESFNSPF